MLTEKEIQFLSRRKLFTSTWKTAAGVLLTGLGLLLIGMFFYSPTLVNPVAVAKAIGQGALEVSTLKMAALILPIVVVLLFLVIIIFILFGYSIISREKQYLMIITKVLNSQSPEGGKKVQF